MFLDNIIYAALYFLKCYFLVSNIPEVCLVVSGALRMPTEKSLPRIMCLLGNRLCQACQKQWKQKKVYQSLTLYRVWGLSHPGVNSPSYRRIVAWWWWDGAHLVSRVFLYTHEPREGWGILREVNGHALFHLCAPVDVFNKDCLRCVPRQWPSPHGCPTRKNNIKTPLFRVNYCSNVCKSPSRKFPNLYVRGRNWQTNIKNAPQRRKKLIQGKSLGTSMQWHNKRLFDMPNEIVL